MVRKVRERVWKISSDLYHKQCFEDVLAQRKRAGWLVLTHDISSERNVECETTYYILHAVEIFLGSRRVLSDQAKKLVEYYNSPIGKAYRLTFPKLTEPIPQNEG